MLDEKRILIIDDEERMARSLCSLLRGNGYLADAAISGSEGLACLARVSYHIVVTDLRMQDVDGHDIIRHVHAAHPDTLVIVITGYATTESAIEAVRCHVFDYLRKPFEFDVLRLAIEKAIQKIESDQLREDTAAMITHDIKVPLTSIIGFASLLFDERTGDVHPRAREFAETIQANGTRILELIENYLTTFKIESGNYSITPMDVALNELIHDVIESLRILAQRLGAEISVETHNLPPTVRIDQVVLYRALGNLLGNALKYGNNAEPVRLIVKYLAPDPLRAPCGSLRAIIRNTTDHELPADAAELFQRLRRAAPSAGVDGTGLGLYVVRAIIEAHHGTVWIRLIEPGRVECGFELPLADPKGQLPDRLPQPLGKCP